MILLDTKVISELMRPRPDTHVVQWLDGLPEEEVWISAVTAAEIRLGLSFLPEGKRKKLLLEQAEQMILADFPERCLPFDCEAASEYARIITNRNQQGRPISIEDAQIAAIALTAGLTVATRNTKDFSSITGLKVVNPWAA